MQTKLNIYSYIITVITCITQTCHTIYKQPTKCLCCLATRGSCKYSVRWEVETPSGWCGGWLISCQALALIICGLFLIMAELSDDPLTTHHILTSNSPYKLHVKQPELESTQFTGHSRVFNKYLLLLDPITSTLCDKCLLPFSICLLIF